MFYIIITTLKLDSDDEIVVKPASRQAGLNFLAYCKYQLLSKKRHSPILPNSTPSE